MNRTAIKRSAKPIPRSPLRKRSAKQRNRMKRWRKHTDDAIALYGFRCAICREFKELEGHHILPRSQGGTECSDNVMPLCRQCHERVHNEPAWAYCGGFLRKRESVVTA